MRVSGQNGRSRLRRAAGTALGLVAAAGALVPQGCSVRPEGPRAVFLVVVDTLRADRLSCYGYPGHSTPGIDGLAARGTVFRRAHAQASWTNPSMGAILTSRHPARLGMLEKELAPDAPPALPPEGVGKRQHREQIRWTLPRGPSTVAERFLEAGYQTAAFVNQPGLNFSEAWHRGFDRWMMPADPRTIVPWSERAAGRPPNWSASDVNVQAFETDRNLVGAVSSWLETRDGETPVFALVHLLTPHAPYNPPRRFARAPSGEGASLFARLSADYDGEVRAVDSVVAELLAAIDLHVGLDDALIVFTSDHGEEFGEHGRWEHGHSMHREVVHVPLIVAGPGVPRGVTVDAVVRSVDIMPSLLQLAGHGDRIPADAAGESLAPLTRGEGGDRMALMQGVLYGPSRRAIVAEGYKLIVDLQDRSARLYGIDADWSERRDLSAERPEAAATLRERLVAADGRMLSARAAEGSEDREELMEALRSLGYVSD